MRIGKFLKRNSQPLYVRKRTEHFHEKSDHRTTLFILLKGFDCPT